MGLVSKEYYNFVHGLFNSNKNDAKNLRSAIITTEDSFAGTDEKIQKILLFISFQNWMKN